VTYRVAVAAAAAAATLLLAGCTGDGAPAPEAPSVKVLAGAASVDVDTPELRAQRAAAGIARCTRPAEAGGGSAGGGGLPELSLPCLGGGPDVELSSLRGPLVVNMWAQWCEPCRRELPYFARLHEEVVDVLGVDFEDAQPAAALALAERAGVTYPLVADVDGKVRAPLRLSAIPTTVFIDRDGRVASVLAQEFTSYDQLADAVDAHLGIRP
jgi:thiol-disulfide isomerase/thioredoxin